MANQAPAAAPTAPALTDIRSNQFTIESGSVKAGSISFQIRNIASLEIESAEDPDLGSKLLIAGAALLVAWIAFGATINGLLGFAAGIAAGGFVLWRNPPLNYWQLKILTNAASSFRLLSANWDWLHKVKAAIEEAMERRDNGVTFKIDQVSHNIERVENNMTTVTNTNSPGANTAVNVAGRVDQSSNVTVQGLQDVSELMQIVGKHGGAEAEVLKRELEVIRQFLAGGIKTKTDAKAAWERFTEKVGMVAGAGNQLWLIVARMADLLR